MKRFYRWLVHQSVPHLIRVACFAALIALGSMAYSVISLKPLPVIFAMSVGHAIGVFAFLLYLLAVILDTQRGSVEPHGAAPPPPDPGAESGESERASARDQAATRGDSRRDDEAPQDAAQPSTSPASKDPGAQPSAS